MEWGGGSCGGNEGVVGCVGWGLLSLFGAGCAVLGVLSGPKGCPCSRERKSIKSGALKSLQTVPIVHEKVNV